MASKDRLLLSELHGAAWRHAAAQRNLSESIAELGEMVAGRNDILAEAAGIQAGSWYASPATHVGHELTCAGMLILAGGGKWTTATWSDGHGLVMSAGCGHAKASAESSQRDNSDSGR
jgi:hypothetical protein